MSATNAFEQAIINHFLRNNAQTPAVTLYAALFSAVADEEASSVTELSGGSYARKAVAFDAPSAGGTTQNSADLTFDAGVGTATHVGIFTASTGGTLLAVAALSASKTLASGDQLLVPAGSLTISLN